MLLDATVSIKMTLRKTFVQILECFGDQSDLLVQVEILERTPFDKLNPIARERLGAKEVSG